VDGRSGSAAAFWAGWSRPAGRGAGFALHDGAGQAYVTQLGEIRRVPLGDGSVMTINSDTELKVTSPATRQIELAQGEAWFEVAKDAPVPLSWRRAMRARRIGTAFSVRKREGVEVLVTEGVVETWTAADPASACACWPGSALINERAVVHYQASETAR
jgi:transmembrane sensor